MPQPVSKVRAGTWYHLVNRGADQAILFPTPREKNAFVAGLGNVARRFTVEIHAYCAMESHYHILARGEEAELRRAAAHLEADIRASTEGVRLRRMAVGRHLLGVTRYIHLNPVEAGLAPTPQAWPWSSYRSYLDPLLGPRWIRSSAVLGWLGSIGARQLYRQFVERGLGHSNPPAGAALSSPPFR